MQIEILGSDGVGEHRAQAVLALWETHGALTGEAALQRLTAVVCVLVDDQDEVVGVNSATATSVGFLGGRRFWVYRRFIAPTTGDAHDAAMLGAAFEELQRRSQQPGAPLGLCAMVDREVARHHPEAVWPDSAMLHAGFLEDGRQVRVRYFDGARIA